MKKTFKTVLSVVLLGWAAGSKAQSWKSADEDGLPAPVVVDLRYAIIHRVI